MKMTTPPSLRAARESGRHPAKLEFNGVLRRLGGVSPEGGPDNLQ